MIHTLTADQAAPARRLLEEIAASYGVTHRLICVPPKTNAADQLLLALQAAQAGSVLLLGEDVLPQAPEWLAPLIEALGRKSGAAVMGGTLLEVDGSVAHAGGWLAQLAVSQPVTRTLRLWGMPAVDLGSATTVATDLVTADCVGLKPAAVSALIRAGATVPDPDALLQQVVISFGTARAARTWMQHRFVRFSPAPITDPVVAAATNASLGAMIDHHRLARFR